MKKLKYLAFAALMMGGILPLMGQTALRSLTIDDLVAWRRITRQAISDDGKWVACKMEPWVGDATVELYDAAGKKRLEVPRADSLLFSASSRYLLVSQTPGKALTDSLKVLKTKKDQMPMNALVIYAVTGTQETIDSLKSFRLAEKADWLAYQCGRKDSSLHVRPLGEGEIFHIPAVKEYGFAAKSGMLYYVTSGDENDTKPGLYAMDTATGTISQVKEGKGTFKQMTFDENGDRLAFLYCEGKDSTYRAMDLWLSTDGGAARKVASRGNEAFPEGWVISEHGKLKFSKTGSRLFFGTSPEPRQKDTLQLAENRPEVQVWSWNEPVQYTMQSFMKERELKRSYSAVYNVGDGSIFQLADVDLPELILGKEGDAPVALLSGYRAYSLSSMWEGRTRFDYYTVSLEDGRRAPLSKADYTRYRLSPQGKYAYGYAETDSCWYAFSLTDGQKTRLTTPQTFTAWDEENDVPDYPRSYGAAGWTENDAKLLVYDRYDIWELDPSGTKAPVNLTIDGRQNHVTYKLVELDKEERFIHPDKPQLLKGFDQTTKGYGYYTTRFTAPASPKTLMAGNYMLRTIVKAKQADKVIFTIETFEQYPDIHYAGMDFKNPVRLTSGIEQQAGIRWGTPELITWTSLDGQQLEGVVYKPVDFDPSRKYPLIVNFYERNAETLYNYRMPEAHRSTVDYHLYNSLEYIIFNPDIRYPSDGYPGEDCYNCLMPGIAKLINEGYVDEHAIGAQGHSWGGYQVAYLATRTPLFAAIESGAPVVNMFSAYGGIRWGSGMARAFQYEHEQSRLNATPWSSPKRFFENSALFSMDKVQTPILIMHNDSDGHVPWYQGIEFFVAMKRLGKPCWLLNYPGEPHWPMKMANRIDFQKRMLQFFNHYLKHEPMPQWMSEGLPAIDQPFELGY